MLGQSNDAQVPDGILFWCRSSKINFCWFVFLHFTFWLSQSALSVHFNRVVMDAMVVSEKNDGVRA